MAIEDTLNKISATLEAILVIAQTANLAPAELGIATNPPAADKPANKKASAKATAATGSAAALDEQGNPNGTIYWIIDKHNTVYAQKPGEPAPSIEGAIIATVSEYVTKKEEYEKKFALAAAANSTAADAPSATATAGTASATNATQSVGFKDVVVKLQDLAKAKTDEAPLLGRTLIVGILAKYLPELAEADRKVPLLEALGKNAEILVDVESAIASTVATEVNLFG